MVFQWVKTTSYLEGRILPGRWNPPFEGCIRPANFWWGGSTWVRRPTFKVGSYQKKVSITVPLRCLVPTRYLLLLIRPRSLPVLVPWSTKFVWRSWRRPERKRLIWAEFWTNWWHEPTKKKQSISSTLMVIRSTTWTSLILKTLKLDWRLRQSKLVATLKLPLVFTWSVLPTCRELNCQSDLIGSKINRSISASNVCHLNMAPICSYWDIKHWSTRW